MMRSSGGQARVRKFFAWSTLVFFLPAAVATGVPDALAAAAPAEMSAKERFVDSFSRGLTDHIGTIEADKILPAEIRKDRTPLFVLVQDAHSNPQAQENIASILQLVESEAAEEQLPFRIAVEGARGPIHPEYFDFFPEYPRAGDAIVKSLLASGELTGAELFAWQHYRNASGETPNERPVIFGIEDPDAYRENLQTYRSLLAGRDSISASLDRGRRELMSWATRSVDSELLDLIRKRDRYMNGRFALTRQSQRNIAGYIRHIAQLAARHLKIELGDPSEQLRFPSLFRFLKLQEAEELLDREKASDEWQKLSMVLQAWPASEALEKVRESFRQLGLEYRFLNAREIKVGKKPEPFTGSPRAFLEDLIELGSARGLDWSGFENFFMSMRLAVFHSELSADDLLEEVQRVEDALMDAFANEPDEKLFLTRLRQMEHLEKLMLLELAPRDFELMNSRNAMFSLSALSETFEKLGGDRAQLAQAFAFYETAIERDRLFIENTFSELGAFEAGGKEFGGVLVMISGGFHTAGLERLLEDRGFPYLTVRPQISKVDGGEQYRRVIGRENADTTIYFGVPDSFSTRQEAVLFRQVIEKGIPALRESGGLSADEISEIVKRGFESHPILSRVIEVNWAAPGESPALQFVSRLSGAGVSAFALGASLLSGEAGFNRSVDGLGRAGGSAQPLAYVWQPQGSASPVRTGRSDLRSDMDSAQFSFKGETQVPWEFEVGEAGAEIGLKGPNNYSNSAEKTVYFAFMERLLRTDDDVLRQTMTRLWPDKFSSDFDVNAFRQKAGTVDLNYNGEGHWISSGNYYTYSTDFKVSVPYEGELYNFLIRFTRGSAFGGMTDSAINQTALEMLSVSDPKIVRLAALGKMLHKNRHKPESPFSAPFYVTEFVEGRPLREIINETRSDTARLTEEARSALAFLQNAPQVENPTERLIRLENGEWKISDPLQPLYKGSTAKYGEMPYESYLQRFMASVAPSLVADEPLTFLFDSPFSPAPGLSLGGEDFMTKTARIELPYVPGPGNMGINLQKQLIEYILRTDDVYLGNVMTRLWKESFNQPFDAAAFRSAAKQVTVTYLASGAMKDVFTVMIEMKNGQHYLFSIKPTQLDVTEFDAPALRHSIERRINSPEKGSLMAGGVRAVAYGAEKQVSYFMAEEFVEGPTLKEILKSDADADYVLQARKNAAEAFLDYRVADPKPENIVAENGDITKMRVIDDDKMFTQPAEDKTLGISAERSYRERVAQYLGDEAVGIVRRAEDAVPLDVTDKGFRVWAGKGPVTIADGEMLLGQGQEAGFSMNVETGFVPYTQHQFLARIKLKTGEDESVIEIPFSFSWGVNPSTETYNSIKAKAAFTIPADFSGELTAEYSTDMGASWQSQSFTVTRGETARSDLRTHNFDFSVPSENPWAYKIEEGVLRDEERQTESGIADLTAHHFRIMESLLRNDDDYLSALVKRLWPEQFNQDFSAASFRESVKGVRVQEAGRGDNKKVYEVVLERKEGEALTFAQKVIVRPAEETESWRQAVRSLRERQEEAHAGEYDAGEGYLKFGEARDVYYSDDAYDIFLAEEFIPGRTLAEYLRDPSIENDVKQRAVAMAVEAFRKQPVQDPSPDNIIAVGGYLSKGFKVVDLDRPFEIPEEHKARGLTREESFDRVLAHYYGTSAVGVELQAGEGVPADVKSVSEPVLSVGRDPVFREGNTFKVIGDAYKNLSINVTAAQSAGPGMPVNVRAVPVEGETFQGNVKQMVKVEDAGELLIENMGTILFPQDFQGKFKLEMSADGGSTWVPYPAPSGNVFEVQVLDERHREFLFSEPQRSPVALEADDEGRQGFLFENLAMEKKVIAALHGVLEYQLRHNDALLRTVLPELRPDLFGADFDAAAFRASPSSGKVSIDYEGPLQSYGSSASMVMKYRVSIAYEGQEVAFVIGFHRGGDSQKDKALDFTIADTSGKFLRVPLTGEILAVSRMGPRKHSQVFKFFAHEHAAGPTIADLANREGIDENERRDLLMRAFNFFLEAPPIEDPQPSKVTARGGNPEDLVINDPLAGPYDGSSVRLGKAAYEELVRHNFLRYMPDLEPYKKRVFSFSEAPSADFGYLEPRESFKRKGYYSSRKFPSGSSGHLRRQEVMEFLLRNDDDYLAGIMRNIWPDEFGDDFDAAVFRDGTDRVEIAYLDSGATKHVFTVTFFMKNGNEYTFAIKAAEDMTEEDGDALRSRLSSRERDPRLGMTALGSVRYIWLDEQLINESIFIAEEFVPGITLGDVLSDKSLDDEVKLHAVEAAVETFRSTFINDPKPENIVARNGDLTDWVVVDADKPFQYTNSHRNRNLSMGEAYERLLRRYYSQYIGETELRPEDFVALEVQDTGPLKASTAAGGLSMAEGTFQASKNESVQINFALKTDHATDTDFQVFSRAVTPDGQEIAPLVKGGAQITEGRTDAYTADIYYFSGNLPEDFEGVFKVQYSVDAGLSWTDYEQNGRTEFRVNRSDLRDSEFRFDGPVAVPWEHTVDQGYLIGEESPGGDEAFAIPRFQGVIEHLLRNKDTYLQEFSSRLWPERFPEGTTAETIRAAVDKVAVSYLGKGGLKYVFVVDFFLKDGSKLRFAMKPTKTGLWEEDESAIMWGMGRWKDIDKDSVARFGAEETVYFKLGRTTFGSRSFVIAQEFVEGRVVGDILEEDNLSETEKRELLEKLVDFLRKDAPPIVDPNPSNVIQLADGRFKLFDIDKFFGGQSEVLGRSTYDELLAFYYADDVPSLRPYKRSDLRDPGGVYPYFDTDTFGKRFGLNVSHDQVTALALRENGTTRLGLFHNGDTFAADINFRPNDMSQGGMGLGEFDNEAVYEMAEIYNDRAPAVSPETPGDRLILTGREISRLGMGPHTPLLPGDQRVFRFKKMSSVIPLRGSEIYRALAHDSLKRYNRYGPIDRFNHSFIMREIIRLLQNEVPGYTLNDLLHILTDIIDADPDTRISDLSPVFGDLLSYRPDLRESLERELVTIAVETVTTNPLVSEVAIKMLRSAEIGEVVLTGPETLWTAGSGGLGLQMTDLSIELAEMGIAVTVVTPLYSNIKEEVFKKFSPYDTGRTIIIKFGRHASEWQTVKLYEKYIDGVRVVFLENDRYFNRLKGEAGQGSAYHGFDTDRLRFTRMLSLGTLGAIREKNIHAKIIQTNDWTTGYLKAYLEGRERIDGEYMNLEEDPHLAEAKVTHIAHNLEFKYHGKAFPADQVTRDGVIRDDLGLSPEQDYDVLFREGEWNAINPTFTAIKTSDHVKTVSAGYHDRSLAQRYDKEFGGLVPLLQWKDEMGDYDGGANGWGVVARQRAYLAKMLKDEEVRGRMRWDLDNPEWRAANAEFAAYLDNVFDNPDEYAVSFLDLGREADRRDLARVVLNYIQPIQKRRLQQAVGLPVNENAFVYGMLHRIDEQKGHQLLLADIWSAEAPKKLKTLPDQLFEEMTYGLTLNDEDAAKIEAYARAHNRETLRAVEVAMILMPDAQFVITGAAAPKSYYDLGFQAVAENFPDQFYYFGGFVRPSDDLYELLYSGSTRFGMPSLFEPGGLSNQEAAGYGVLRHVTRRDGLSDGELRTNGFAEGFELFNPVDWMRSIYYGHYPFYRDRPVEENELRYRAMIQDNRWLTKARGYLSTYYSLLDVEPAVDLQALEVAGAIHRARLKGHKDPADELMRAGFTVDEAIFHMLRSVRESDNEILVSAIINNHLTELGKVSDEVKNTIATELESALKAAQKSTKRYSEAIEKLKRSDLRAGASEEVVAAEPLTSTREWLNELMSRITPRFRVEETPGFDARAQALVIESAERLGGVFRVEEIAGRISGRAVVYRDGETATEVDRAGAAYDWVVYTLLKLRGMLDTSGVTDPKLSAFAQSVLGEGRAENAAAPEFGYPVHVHVPSLSADANYLIPTLAVVAASGGTLFLNVASLDETEAARVQAGILKRAESFGIHLRANQFKVFSAEGSRDMASVPMRQFDESEAHGALGEEKVVRRLSWQNGLGRFKYDSRALSEEELLAAYIISVLKAMALDRRIAESPDILDPAALDPASFAFLVNAITTYLETEARIAVSA